MEIDWEAKVWNVPRERMKKHRDHRVPLTDAAMAVLCDMRKRTTGPLVFPGDRREQLSDMSLAMLLRRMKHGHVTPHGFRSSFRTWAAEETNFATAPTSIASAASAMRSPGNRRS
jgi:integrase